MPTGLRSRGHTPALITTGGRSRGQNPLQIAAEARSRGRHASTNAQVHAACQPAASQKQLPAICLVSQPASRVASLPTDGPRKPPSKRSNATPRTWGRRPRARPFRSGRSRLRCGPCEITLSVLLEHRNKKHKHKLSDVRADSLDRRWTPLASGATIGADSQGEGVTCIQALRSPTPSTRLPGEYV